MLQKAVELDRSHPNVVNNLGLAYLGLGKIDREVARRIRQAIIRPDLLPQPEDKGREGGSGGDGGSKSGATADGSSEAGSSARGPRGSASMGSTKGESKPDEITQASSLFFPGKTLFDGRARGKNKE